MVAALTYVTNWYQIWVGQGYGAVNETSLYSFAAGEDEGDVGDLFGDDHGGSIDPGGLFEGGKEAFGLREIETADPFFGSDDGFLGGGCGLAV